MATITRPVTTSSTMATILIRPNQNSTSPKAFTASMFRPSNRNMVPKAGSQVGTSGYQYCTNPATTTTSPTAATTQLSQYDQLRM